MFKISKLTDYSVVLLGHLAMSFGQGAAPSSARDLAKISGLPLPTVSKLLKALARQGLIVAKRGALGGYELLRHPRDISVLSLIEAFEGRLAITACLKHSSDSCMISASCEQKSGWQVVHKKIAELLSEMSLSDLMRGKSYEQ
jgi:FeS assembly SUF system regulator